MTVFVHDDDVAVLVEVVLVVSVPMDVLRSVGMAMQMTVLEMLVVVIVMSVAARFAPTAVRDPKSECNERKRRDQRHFARILRRSERTGIPNDGAEQQRGSHVSDARSRSGPSRLRHRPAALTGNSNDRSPMIGDHRVQYADSRYGEYEGCCSIHER